MHQLAFSSIVQLFDKFQFDVAAAFVLLFCKTVPYFYEKS